MKIISPAYTNYSPSIKTVENKKFNTTNSVSFGDSFIFQPKDTDFHKFVDKISLKAKNLFDNTQVERFVMSADPSKCDYEAIKKVVRISNVNGLDPFDTLFIVNGQAHDGKFETYFNSFFIDENGEEKMQFIILTSTSPKMTKTQKAAYKLFYDDETRKKLASNSIFNPLYKMENSFNSDELKTAIKDSAKNIQNPALDDFNSRNEYYPVFFSKDGKITYYYNSQWI